MREILCAATAALLGAAIAWPGSLQVSTGFLIGPRHDPHAFSVRNSSAAAWQKTGSTAEFRKAAQGRLLGVTVTAAQADLQPLALHGLRLVRVALQPTSGSLFAPNGALRPAETAHLHALLDAASAHGEALTLDPRSVERPILVREKTAHGCTAALYRQLAPLVLKPVLRPPKP